MTSRITSSRTRGRRSLLSALTLSIVFIVSAAAIVRSRGAAADSPAVTIRVDASKSLGPLPPVWRFFGYDEPNYTYMRDGKILLSDLAALSPRTVYVRAHNLLTTGDGTPALKWGSTNAYTEDEQGKPRYDWTIIDRIFDTYRERGMRPYVQIGFMPKALSTHPDPYQHEWTPGGKASISTGWAYPPKDYEKWGGLVHEWVKHSVERYGKDEVENWYWEVWNEPNIFYWRGTPEEFHTLYDYAVDGVKRALPTAKVGGPHVAGPKSAGGAKFLRDFLEHCVRGTNHATGKSGAPLDFIAFHAKGNPVYIDPQKQGGTGPSHVRMGIASQLQDIDRGFEIVASFPELKDKPIIIGESDPDGCAACPASVYPQNGYRTGTLFSSYTAAVFARKYALAAKHGVNFEGAVTWAFEFEDQPYFAGFRVLETNGIALPVMNVFRMFGLMGNSRLAIESTGDLGLEEIRARGVRGPASDISALASREAGAIAVLLWNYHDDDLPRPDASVVVEMNGISSYYSPVLLEHYRIDRDHSNAFEAWKRLGSPAKPTSEQLETLQRASNLDLLMPPSWIRPVNGKLSTRLTLPSQAVSLLVFRAKDPVR